MKQCRKCMFPHLSYIFALPLINRQSSPKIIACVNMVSAHYATFRTNSFHNKNFAAAVLIVFGSIRRYVFKRRGSHHHNNKCFELYKITALCSFNSADVYKPNQLKYFTTDAMEQQSSDLRCHTKGFARIYLIEIFCWYMQMGWI